MLLLVDHTLWKNECKLAGSNSWLCQQAVGAVVTDIPMCKQHSYLTLL